VTQREKLIERIRSRPAEARFSDVRSLLEEFGWTVRNVRGSHVTFKAAGQRPIVVPKVGGNKVKREYLDMICDRLGLDTEDGNS
jgi:predicted RNA binding protein YcfA (HicA-like mRNA interferase family)